MVIQFIKQIRNGFTLAEVLITLGIIGVVCAITIPTLMNNVQDNQFKTAYKKAYSLASQVISSGYANSEFHDISEGTYNFDVFKSSFNVAKDCSSNDNGSCWASSGEKACDGSCGGGGLPNSTCHAFIDNSGMAWSAYSPSESILLVDTNGNAQPNQYGKDRWFFPSSAITTGKITPNADRATTWNFACHYPPCYFTSWLYN